MKELDAYDKQDLICSPVKWVSSRTGIHGRGMPCYVRGGVTLVGSNLAKATQCDLFSSL